MCCGKKQKKLALSVGVVMHDGLKCGKETQVQDHGDCIVRFLHSVDFLTEKEQIIHVHFSMLSLHCSAISGLIEFSGFLIYRQGLPFVF